MKEKRRRRGCDQQCDIIHIRLPLTLQCRSTSLKRYYFCTCYSRGVAFGTARREQIASGDARYPLRS